MKEAPAVQWRFFYETEFSLAVICLYNCSLSRSVNSLFNEENKASGCANGAFYCLLFIDDVI